MSKRDSVSSIKSKIEKLSRNKSSVSLIKEEEEREEEEKKEEEEEEEKEEEEEEKEYYVKNYDARSDISRQSSLFSRKLSTNQSLTLHFYFFFEIIHYKITFILKFISNSHHHYKK